MIGDWVGLDWFDLVCLIGLFGFGLIYLFWVDLFGLIGLGQFVVGLVGVDLSIVSFLFTLSSLRCLVPKQQSPD